MSVRTATLTAGSGPTSFLTQTLEFWIRIAVPDSGHLTTHNVAKLDQTEPAVQWLSSTSHSATMPWFFSDWHKKRKLRSCWRNDTFLHTSLKTHKDAFRVQKKNCTWKWSGKYSQMMKKEMSLLTKTSSEPREIKHKEPSWQNLRLALENTSPALATNHAQRTTQHKLPWKRNKWGESRQHRCKSLPQTQPSPWAYGTPHVRSDGWGFLLRDSWKTAMSIQQSAIFARGGKQKSSTSRYNWNNNSVTSVTLWGIRSRHESPYLFWRSAQARYGPQGSGRSAGGSAGVGGWMRRWGRWREWRTQGRRETLITCEDEMTCAPPLSHAVQCVNHDDKNLTNKENCALTCQCFMCAVLKVFKVLVVTLSLVSCGVTTQT